MSDAVQLAIITGVFSLLTIIVTHFINMSTRKRMDVVKEKVEEYHKEVNGKMGLLLKTTKELGEEIGKQKEKENPS